MDMNQLRQLIERGETTHCEFKGALQWDGDSRAKLTKAIAAMANTRDGGTLVVGIDDDRVQGKPVLRGLTKEQLASFDTTKIAEYINSRFEPDVHLHVEKHTIDGHDLAVIVVTEFENEPILCTKEGSHAAALQFKPGDLLVRTASAQSTVVSPAELRELLGRAVAKKGDHLLDQMRRIVTGALPAKSTDWRSAFATELAQWEATRREALNPLGSRGGWSFRLVPTAPTPPRERTPQQLRELMGKSSVALRGWPMPPIDSTITNHSNRIHSVVEYSGGEQWDLFTRLVFGDVRPHWEDQGLAGESPSYKPTFNAEDATKSIGEFLLFAKRLLVAADYDGPVDIEISISGCMGRKIVAPNRLLYNVYRSAEDTITVGESIDVTTIQSGWEDVGANLTEKVFTMFNWNRPPRDSIVNDLRNLIARK